MTGLKKIEFILDGISIELAKKDVLNGKRRELMEKEEIYLDKMRRMLQIDSY